MTNVSETARQQQFLDVIDRDEAERRFHDALKLDALARETIDLEQALGRVLASDVAAAVDVPSFDRSNYDGFAVRAADTFGAEEEAPRQLHLLDESIAAAVVPDCEITTNTVASIATGGMIPRGADAVVMVEHTEIVAHNDGPGLLVRKAVPAGFGIAYTGSDVAAGETVLRRGQLLTSRETGVLAAIGVTKVSVHRQPRVAIISTGDEIIAPGEPMQPARVYDSNARILADAVRELGGLPTELGIVGDDELDLTAKVTAALNDHDVVLLSGGTSKGAGDISYRVVQRFDDPGIVVHGVALKPGKPICLAATAGKPVVILPGFPTSAIFTFHEFVAPVIRRLAGRPQQTRHTLAAELAVKVNSVVGRTEYNLVGLVRREDTTDSGPEYAAYPLGKGSGSVTTFSNADGFISIDRHTEIVAAGETVAVQLLGRDLQVADLVVIGSHCLGLDYLLGLLQEQGFVTKFISVGSTAGLDAAKRGECDMAGVHLLDEQTGQYNVPFLSPELELIRGYERLQGVIYRADDSRFVGNAAEQAIADVAEDANCLMINRNRGSGTRILIDGILDGKQPAGYAVQAKTHSAVAAAVLQGRADWGVAIKTVVTDARLGFLPLKNEQFDFILPKSHGERPAVHAFRKLLASESSRAHIRRLMTFL